MRLLALALVVTAAALAACDGDVTDPDGTGGSGTGGSGGSGAAGGTGAAGGGGSSSGEAGSGGAGGEAPMWYECFGTDGQHVQSGLSECTGETCLMVEHQIDCCGTIMLVGIEAGSQAHFAACEAAWRATLPICNCPPGLPQVQQPYGQTVSSAADATVGCINWTMESGVCLTTPQ